MPTHRERHAKRAAQAQATSAHEDESEGAAVRLDKWLWVARFYKTRALAHSAIEAGKIRLDGERAKPAHPVRRGDCFQISRDGLLWNIKVQALSDKRGSAVIAAALYTEDASSIEARAVMIAQRNAAIVSSPYGRGRPTKRQRRKIEDFLAEP